MSNQPALYLIPVNISESPLDTVLPAHNIQIIKELKHYIVENIRTARRFLKQCDRSIDIDTLTFHELNRHTDLNEVSGWLAPLRTGESVGVMSEAGCPAVADPGSLPVKIAQSEGLRVVPLTGPSSILLSLMGSGFNGQGFSFHGYLPIDHNERTKTLRQLEASSERDDMTRIFIETPYRNNRMLEAIVSTLRDDTMVCVACDITDSSEESIVTKSVAQWKKTSFDYNKRPAIFLIYREGNRTDRKQQRTNRR